MSYSQWTQLNSGTTNNLFSVFFINKDTGYVVGSAGTILKTTDGGENWEEKNSGISNWLSQIFFMDENNGIIVGEKGTILKTIDGGENWEMQNSGTIINLNSVYFTSLNSGVAVGSKGTILRTTDGGVNWIRLPSISLYNDTTYELYSVRFSSENIGYAAGGRWLVNPNAMIIKTIDGGGSWNIIYQNDSYEPLTICSLFPINDNRVWALGYGYPNTYGPRLIYTNDAGANITLIGWPPFWYYPNSFADGIYFPNINTGYMAGYDSIVVTTDGGISWQQQYAGVSGHLDAIFFVNDFVGYSVGDGGIIIKTNNGGGILSIDEPVKGDNIVIIPNPSDGRFVLKAVDNETFLKDLQITVFNCLGESFIPKTLTIQSENQIIVNMPVLRSGIYLMKLESYFAHAASNIPCFKKLIISKEN